MAPRASVLILKAKLAFESERFDDMADFMRAVLRSGHKLSGEERTMLTIAYKNVMSPRFSAIERLVDVEHNQQDLAIEARDYRRTIELEIARISRDLIKAIDDFLAIEHATAHLGIDAHIFYLKTKAEHLRYVITLEAGDKPQTDNINKTNQAYEQAFLLASSKLRPANATRLGLVFEYSVFIESIMGARNKAIEIARETFEGACSEIDYLENEPSFNESVTLLRQIHEKIHAWTSAEILGKSKSNYELSKML